MRLVIDASLGVRLAMESDGFALLGDAHELSAPPLLWSESVSVLHELCWRKEISPQLGELAMQRLLGAPVEPATPAGLLAEGWRIADAAGWAKTYDAEYVAAARLTDRILITLDSRLRRGAARFVDVRTPIELS